MLEFIRNNYSNLNDKQIVICGDGDFWIQNIASYLGVPYVLDKFHLMKEVKDCYKIGRYGNSKRKWIVNDIRELAKHNDIDKLIDLVNKSETFFDDLEVQKNIRALKRYIRNHIDGIKNWTQDWYDHCYAESVVSHVIKSLKGYGKSIYSKHNFINILYIRLSKINKIDIFKYLNDDEREIFSLDIESKLIDKILNPEDENGVYLKMSDIPILKYKTIPANKFIRNLLNKVN